MTVKAILLVWIHGFKGDETTFVNFPNDVFSALKRQHPELNIQHDIYPKYRTVGELQVCTAAFIRWMDRRVDAMRAELGFGREQVCDEDMGGGAPAVSEYSVAGDKELAVFLIGHSMGGLLAADAAAVLNGLEAPYEEPKKKAKGDKKKDKDKKEKDKKDKDKKDKEKKDKSKDKDKDKDKPTSKDADTQEDRDETNKTGKEMQQGEDVEQHGKSSGRDSPVKTPEVHEGRIGHQSDEEDEKKIAKDEREKVEQEVQVAVSELAARPAPRVRDGRLVTGVIAIDTPFIGIHPNLVAYGFDQLDALVSKALISSNDFFANQPAWLNKSWKGMKVDKWLNQPSSFFFKRGGVTQRGVEWGLGVPAHHSSKSSLSVRSRGGGKEKEGQDVGDRREGSMRSIRSVSRSSFSSVSQLEPSRRSSLVSDVFIDPATDKDFSGTTHRLPSDADQGASSRLNARHDDTASTAPVSPHPPAVTARGSEPTEVPMTPAPPCSPTPPLASLSIQHDQPSSPSIAVTQSGSRSAGGVPPPLPPRQLSTTSNTSASCTPPPLPLRPSTSRPTSLRSTTPSTIVPAISVQDVSRSRSSSTSRRPSNRSLSTTSSLSASPTPTGSAEASSTNQAVVVEGESTEKPKKKKGFKWLSEHLIFLASLWQLEDVRRRMENMALLREKGMVFVNFYAVVPPKTSMPHSHKRTFISLPTKHHPTRESWKEVDIELEDQVEAHLGLFMRDKNKGYERLIGMVLDEIGLGVERA